MAEEDSFYSIDLGNVTPIHNQIVVVIAGDKLRLDQGLRQNPLLGLPFDWMAWRDHQSIAKFAHSRFTLPGLGFDHTGNCCTNTFFWSGDLITLLQILD
jgi:hypothetical protein